MYVISRSVAIFIRLNFAHDVNICDVHKPNVGCVYQDKKEGGPVAVGRAGTLQALLEADSDVSVHQCPGLGAKTAQQDDTDRNPPRH